MVAGDIISVKEDGPVDDNVKKSLYDINLISSLIAYRCLNDCLRGCHVTSFSHDIHYNMKKSEQWYRRSVFEERGEACT